jgi:hypothetical protein
MNKEQIRQFFATKKSTPTIIRMGGKSLHLRNLPEDVKEKILNRITEKDEVLAKGRSGILPGILIDGKEVTRENIKDFEVKIKPKKKLVKKKKK